MRLHKIDKAKALEQLELAMGENQKALSELPRDEENKPDRLLIQKDQGKIRKMTDLIYFSHGESIELSDEELDFLANCR